MTSHTGGMKLNAADTSGQSKFEVELEVAAPEAGGVGRVISGTGSEAGPASGARVAILPVVGCGACDRCQNGTDNWCRDPVRLADGQSVTGAIAWDRRAVVDGRLLLPIPDTLDGRLAAGLPLIGAILRALRHCRSAKPTGSIAVVADPASLSIARALARHCKIDLGIPTTDDSPPPAAALHLSAGAGTLGEAIRAIGDLGIVVTTGPYPADMAVIPDYYREIIIKESVIRGSGRASRADITDALAILGCGDVPVPDINFQFFTADSDD